MGTIQPTVVKIKGKATLLLCIGLKNRKSKDKQEAGRKDPGCNDSGSHNYVGEVRAADLREAARDACTDTAILFKLVPKLLVFYFLFLCMLG